MSKGLSRITRSKKQSQSEGVRQVPCNNIDELNAIIKEDIMCSQSMHRSHRNSITRSSRNSIHDARGFHKCHGTNMSDVNSVAGKLGAVSIDNLIKEDEHELKRNMEQELMALKAKALKEEAELMEKHSLLILESNRSRELRKQQASQQLKADGYSEVNHSGSEYYDQRTEASSKTANMDIMRDYLEDCKRNRRIERIERLDKMIPVDEAYNDTIRCGRLIRAELPRIELPKYDGNTADYWNFIKQFEIHIEGRTTDAQQRILYLLNYCTGKAKSAIKGYAILPAEEGYARARATLKRLFGKPHLVSRNLIDEVLRLPNVRKYDEEALSNLYLKMSECYITLKQMEYMADLDAITTLQKIVDKLPEEMVDRWIRKSNQIYERGREPCFDDLTRFVDAEASVAQSRFAGKRLTTEASRSRPMGSTPRFENKWKISSHNQDDKWQLNKDRVINYVENKAVSKVEPKVCLVCKEAHQTAQCKKYINLSVSQRWDAMKAGNGCYSCLETGHSVKNCMHRKPCGEQDCQRRHHPSLHREPGSDQVQGRSVLNSAREGDNCVSLGVVPVIINGPKGMITICALLDSGANTTIIKKNVIERVGIRGIPTEITINTIVGRTSMKASKCELDVQALDKSDSVHMNGIFAINDLPVKVYNREMPNRDRRWPHLAGIPDNKLDGKLVEMIIGCDQSKAHWVQEVKLGRESQPFGLKTPLGWIVLGPMQQEAVRSVYVTSVQESGEQSKLEGMIQQLYNSDFDGLGCDDKCLSVEEKDAVAIVTKGISKERNQYIVPLPWKTYPPDLADNRPYAMKRLASLRRRFQICPELIERYNGILKTHEEKGYITKVSEGELDNSRVWYLPHHPVFNLHKPDKLRIVFDCAAKYGNNSINDCLHQGPDTIASLVGVLLRFRRLPVVIIADIEEMFLQVRLTKEDQEWMRFLWWKNGKMGEEVDTFKMLVHPFGARSSPFCANFALKQTILDNKEEMSKLTVDIASNNIYVDDCIASVETVEDAKQVIEELTMIMKNGGFRLRKWLSNEKEVLTGVPKEDLASKVLLLTNKDLPVERTLGVEWNAERDQLRFTFQDGDKPSTRRGVLSTVAAVFDPLGLISPIIMKAKILLQKLCKMKFDWDQQLGECELNEWHEWKRQMEHINRLAFHRCIRGGKPESGIQLHVFADASEAGYGAVAYTRVKIAGEYQCRLLMSKARVAPLKTVTIPRLELNAAVLAVRISKAIVKEMDEEFEDMYFWVDSTIVLRYIKNTSSRFVTFVANRIQEILEASRVDQWRHVRSENNPADYTSRGLSVHDVKIKMWMEGPQFLSEADVGWKDDDPSSLDEELLETRKTVLHIELQADTAMDKLLKHYSEWPKLVRAVSWFVRFKDYYKTMKGKGNSVRVGCLTVDELITAETIIIRYVQSRAFPEEYMALSSNNDKFDWRINRLRKLCPELRQGLIVVGGRLQLASMSEDRKHPIILPKSHAITEAIIRHVHKNEGHAGVNQTLVTLRNNYWVLHGGATVKATLRKCLTCRRLNATSTSQRMALLPEVRVKDGWYPFQHVGLDYFGPFMIKRGRMLERRYGCIFTCLQCRAIHLELAQSLSTDSFILALMRFINRRGTPVELWSDNGSNFTGAERELGNWLKGLNQEKITDNLTGRKIVWKFNPPSASHRGGIWERLIRSVRKILNSVAGRQRMDEEVLWTYLTQAERIINDRPLLAVREEMGEPTPIRVSDLLQPKSSSFVAINLPLSQLVERRWRVVNNLTAEFWRKWKADYLGTLQERQKWFRRYKELQVGDVVITEVESSPRTFWPLGLIEEVIPDGDGLVRTVLVRTSNGVCRKDIRKVYMLEGAS